MAISRYSLGLNGVFRLTAFVALALLSTTFAYTQEAPDYDGLGFERVDVVTEFRFTSFRRTDNTSILVTAKSGDNYLLAVDGRISSQVDRVSFSTGRTIRTNSTRLIVEDRSGQTRVRVIAIYAIPTVVAANALVLQLRGGAP